jgi:16S rRNA (guanine(966)-N(2))-methyltransferase RsmD
MRIITGKFKGKALFSPPKNIALRPTSDKVKEAIFDTIRDAVKDSFFLDLFAGSGAVGLEALSEGAKFIVFIDKNGVAIQTLKKNVYLLSAQNDVSIMKRDVLATLKNYQKIEEKITEKFNIIFLDPPFPSLLAGKVVEMLSNFPLLKNDSIVIAEHGTREKLPQEIVGKNTLEKIKEKKYGKIAVTYYKVLIRESNNTKK